MELRVLRYFLEVARTENITKAARYLHISQPTLSKQLKELEEELGKKLFVRSNYSIRLTSEGMLLRRRAQDIVNMADKTADEFRALGEVTGGDIRIGCAESDAIRHLGICTKRLRQKCPGLKIHLYSGNREDVTEWLERGLLDFAVIVHSADLSKYHYMKVPDGDIMGLIMPKEHRLAANPYVELTDILDEPLICSRQSLTEDYPRWFGEQMDRLNIVATFNLIYNAAVLVKQGLGVALSFDRLVDTGPASPLCFRPINPPLHVEMYIIWRKYQEFTPIAEMLLKEMQDYFDSLPPAYEDDEKGNERISLAKQK